MSGTKEKSGDAFSVFKDAGIILAALSAMVYFLHYMYLYGYYKVCKVALVDLHYSLQDILFVNPWVVPIIWLAGMMTGDFFFR